MLAKFLRAAGALVLSFSAVIASAESSMPEGIGFPFVMPFEKSPDAAIDVSPWLDAPAGDEGFVKVKDGHFILGKERIRFWGTNLAFGGDFPDKATAPLLADKLARFGINIVRIHSSDVIDGRPSLIDSKQPDTQHLDMENLDRLDYLIAELKKRGIHTNINLHINRTFKAGDGVTEADALPAYSKNITLYDPRMIELQKEYASDVLTHMNPYTGKSYAEEPAIAFVEITNENSFFYGWYSEKLDNLPESYAAQLDAKWMEYLRAKYESDEAIEKTWKQPLTPGQTLADGNIARPAYEDKTRSAECLTDYLDFLWQIEATYYRDMRDYLKDTLKLRMPITGTMYFTMAGGMIQADLMDFVDMHAYWQHPEFPAEWKGKWTIGNTPMVDQPTSNTLTWLGASRPSGKPFTVSEFNEPWPNFYEAEALPMVAAYAARQDWDGVYIFNFNGNGDYRRERVASFFDIDGHPVKTAQMIAGAAIFARGDVPPATHEQTATVSRGAALTSAIEHGWSKGERALKALGWENTNTPDLKWSMKFLVNELAPVATLAPITGEASSSPMVWKSGLATLNTDRSVMLAGHPTGSAVQLGSVGIELLPSPTNFGVITLTSLDVDPNAIADSSEVLLIASGRTQNSDMKWDEDFRSAVAGTGVAPVLTEGVPARITLPAGKLRVYTLNEAGEPGAEVPVTTDAAGAGFTIGAEYKTIWYLIRRE